MKPDPSDSTRPHQPDPYTGSFLLVAGVVGAAAVVTFAVLWLL